MSNGKSYVSLCQGLYIVTVGHVIVLILLSCPRFFVKFHRNCDWMFSAGINY